MILAGENVILSDGEESARLGEPVGHSLYFLSTGTGSSDLRSFLPEPGRLSIPGSR
jgi:hypothetical protein